MRFYDPDNPFCDDADVKFGAVPIEVAQHMPEYASYFDEEWRRIDVNRFIIKCKSQEQANEVASHFIKAFGLHLTVDHNRILLVNYPKLPSNMSRERFFKHVATAMSTYGRLLDTVSFLPGVGVKNGTASPSETDG